MYSKLQDGSFIICGYVARDSEMKTSQNGKTYTKWSVKVGEKPPETEGGRSEAIWTNCIAWHDIARLAGTIRKGDTVLAVGKLESSSYEGKTYKTLNCEYISIMAKCAGNQENHAESAQNSILAGYEEILGDGDVPF